MKSRAFLCAQQNETQIKTMLNELSLGLSVPTQLLGLLVLASPLSLLLVALISAFQPGQRPVATLKASFWASLTGLLAAAYAAAMVWQQGLLESELLGYAGLGFSLRLDPLSGLLFAMIALLGFIILKFSATYLDGDARHGAFIGRLAATIAAVQLLVLAGNLLLLFLAWVATSLTLHRLLVFYPERPRAVVAARKKFWAARLGDACLLGSLVLLYQAFGHGNLELIFAQLRSETFVAPASLEAAALLLALTAFFKSAQFPTHGWLIEVMETPTPVSALLHAGLLNAGPFLVARMAFVMSETTYAPLLLIVVGGLTAFFASVAFLTQPAVKTALGYSSAAHMGFMLMVCGMGAYPAAMLHLVAHSFYKAHAFLSSGSVPDVLRASRLSAAPRLGSPWRMAAGLGVALLVYLATAALWAVDPTTEVALLATGAMIVMGLAQLIAPTFDSRSYVATTWRALLLVALVATAFFSLEGATEWLLRSQLPALSHPGPAALALISLVLLLFGLTVCLQIAGPAFRAKPFGRSLAIHFRHGWYANLLFDRLVGGWKARADGSRS
jgi:NAD(P)H-quinone oxidoreductase subunit 5